MGGHIERAGFVLLHGDQIGSGMHVSKKMVDSVNENCIMGHVHRYSAFSKAALVTEKKKQLPDIARDEGRHVQLPKACGQKHDRMPPHSRPSRSSQRLDPHQRAEFPKGAYLGTTSSGGHDNCASFGINSIRRADLEVIQPCHRRSPRLAGGAVCAAFAETYL